MSKEIKYCVYLHEFPNGKIYIGITSRKPESRWGSNGCGYVVGRMKHAIKKYGWNNVKHLIIESNLSKQEAEKREIELISEYDSRNSEFGYNVTVGGDRGSLGYKHSKETIDKRSKTMKERYPDGHFKHMPTHHVLQMDLDNNIIAVFDSVSQAEIKLGYNGVWACCKFLCPTIHGFKFRYAEDFDKQYKPNWKRVIYED